MNIRQRKRLMYASAAAVVLLAIAVVVVGLTSPVALPDADGPTQPTGNVAAIGRAMSHENAEPQRGEGDAFTESTLRKLAAVDLRRPLYDPPRPDPPKPVVQRRPLKPITVKLLGTIIEPDNSMAVFKADDGATELFAVGETVEDTGGELRITAIEPYRVTVEYGGETRELTIEPPAKSGLVLNAEAQTPNQ